MVLRSAVQVSINRVHLLPSKDKESMLHFVGRVICKCAVVCISFNCILTFAPDRRWLTVEFYWQKVAPKHQMRSPSWSGAYLCHVIYSTKDTTFPFMCASTVKYDGLVSE